MTTVKVSGLSGIEDALRALADPAAAKRTGQRALKIAAKPIAEMAQRLAPEDEGDLKQSIKVGNAVKGYRTRGNKDLTETFVGIDEGINRRLHIYAEVKEFGNPERNEPAQPYMRPAMDAELPKVLDTVGPILWEEISKAAARKARKAAKAEGE